jgi:Fic family protein
MNIFFNFINFEINFDFDTNLNSLIWEKENYFSHLIEGEVFKNNIEFVDLCQFNFDKTSLVKLNKKILQTNVVDWRKVQTFVGSTRQVKYKIEEKIDYICPQPKDVDNLMQDLFKLYDQIYQVDLVTQITIISFLFIYIHPFEDGNGRISRFLINWILFKKCSIILPISISIYKNLNNYYTALSEFSTKTIQKVENQDGSITVLGETINFYRVFDLKKQQKYMYELIQESILEYKKLEKFNNNLNILKCNFPQYNQKIFHILLNNGQVGSKKCKKYKIEQNMIKILKSFIN